MDPLVASVVQTTGLGVFIWYLFKGLKVQLNSLEKVISAQKQTIEVMDKRIEETEKIGGIYRSLLSDLPADIDNYKTIVSKTKDAVIIELQNQNQEAVKKLDEAQKQIKNSGTSPEQINIHLKALKNLLSKPMNKYGHANELDLKAISEFNEKSVEAAIPIILSSPTLEDFLQKIGFELEISDDPAKFRFIFNERKMPDGSPIVAGFATQSIDGGWLAMANDRMWLSEVRLGQLKDEFSLVKTIV